MSFWNKFFGKPAANSHHGAGPSGEIPSPAGGSRGVDDDDRLLEAEPIARKRMDLLWLDPPRLAQVQQAVGQHGAVTVTMGDSSSLRDHSIDKEDVDWARQIEQMVDRAFAAGKRGHYEDAIRHYKQALGLAPGCDLFLMSVGASYAQLHKKAQAVRYLQRAAQISPGNARIRENLNQAKRM